MPKHEQKPGQRWERRSPRKILRWLLRFLAWSSVVTVAAVAVVAIVSFLIYLNRARIVNNVLEHFVEPFEVTVEKIDLYPIGEVSIRNLQLSPKGAKLENPTLFVPETRLTYDFQTLRRQRQLTSVQLKNPIIQLEDKTLESFRRPQREVASSADFAQFALFTDTLAIEGGELLTNLEGLPRTQAQWRLDTMAFEFDEAGDLLSPISIEVSEIQLENDSRIEQLSTAFAPNRDLTKFHFPFLTVSGIEARINPNWFSRNNSEKALSAEGATDRTPDPPSSTPTWIVRDFSVENSTFSLEGFDGEAGRPRLPEMQFDSSFQLDELRFEGERFTTPGPLDVEFSEIAFGPADSQMAAGAKMQVQAASLESVLEERTFTLIDLEGAEVVMTDETLAPYRIRTQEETPENPSSETARPWIIEKLHVVDGSFVMGGASFSEVAAPRLETAVAGTLSDLRFGGEEGFSSEKESEIRLSNTRLWAPGASAAATPLLQLDRAELVGTWSEFDFDGTLNRFALRGPRIHFTDEALGDWLSAADAPGPEIGPINRPVYRVADLVVSDGKLIADSQFAMGRVPKLIADFSVETAVGPQANPFDYRFLFENVNLRNHAISQEEPEESTDSTLFPEDSPEPSTETLSEDEVLTVRSVELVATAEELQRDRRVRAVKLTGAVLHVGEGLKAIVDSTASEEPEESPTEPAPPAAENASRELPTWILGEVQITQSQVRFESLIPQISGLEFAIETTLTDVPLSPDGLLAQDALQKVELAGLEIKDPYNSFITVAFLPTIFVEFSLAGLARQEVEKIDLIAPSLHVGQGLFWWIDYQRKFREQNEGASVGIENAGEAGTSPDWEIKTIHASAGKIVIAPTGIPIGMVPFPFNATTNMKEGRIELKLEIPDEEGYVYSFPDYEVDLYGLTGNIEFNVPIQQVSNNLVQIFELDRFVWKDYEAENLFLSVTFDENGVYGELGGDAYGGYAEGAFNFYLNDPGKWDAWVAGTEMDTRPITAVLVPDNFLMEGLVSLNLVSEGRDKILGETTGEIQTVGPGWFDITKLDGILENLPADWTNLQRSLTELGLIALKRFDYDKGAGSLYLLGREGNLDLRFAGPYGTRELNLHLHDNRNTTAQVTPQSDPPNDGDAPMRP